MPPYISSSSNWSQSYWSTRSSDHIMLQVPRVNTTFRKTDYSFSASYTFTNILQQTFKPNTVTPIGQFKTLS